MHGILREMRRPRGPYLPADLAEVPARFEALLRGD